MNRDNKRTNKHFIKKKLGVHLRLRLDNVTTENQRRVQENQLNEQNGIRRILPNG